MLLHVLHETRYDYTPRVKTAQHMAHLKPLDGPYQRLLRHSLRIAPEATQRSESLDVYGNARAFFSLQTVHDELAVVADSLVETLPRPDVVDDTPWEAVRERFRYHAEAAWEPAADFVFASPYVPRDEAFATYARPSFGPGVPLLTAVHGLMGRIYQDFTYDAESTDIGTPALEALAQRRGVCQDFAHIMAGCLRTLGLPARYVSGYLLTHPPAGQPRLVGADASHAWVSIYLPGEGIAAGQWCDFDPTNDRIPGEDYVAVATGRDYGDVSPLRGVLHGGANHTLDVGVTVTPVAADGRTPLEPVALASNPSTAKESSV